VTSDTRGEAVAPVARRTWRLSASAVVELGLPLLAALATAAGTCVTLWFHEYEPDLDALGLFNPVYTALKTGHTTYPIYGYPSDMVVHPPTHYWILAQIMHVTGLSGQAAALVPVAFWVAVAAFVIASSRWRVTVKAGLLLAMWFAIVIFAFPNFIRPDIHVAAAWIAGLVALETGRVGAWREWRLALGSFALALASMLHYPASLAVGGVLIYVVWAAVELRGARRLRVLAALIVPAGALLIAYAAIFIFPHLADIKAVTSAQNAQGHGFFAALTQTHREYEYFAKEKWGGSLVTFLMWPLLHWGIPAALVAPPVLALSRQTRALALAMLPFLFTLLFYAREKTIYYYAPDIFAYFAALGVAAFLVLQAVAARVRRPRLTAIAVPLVALGTAVVLGAVAQTALARWGTSSSAPVHGDMDVARAAGARMVGSKGIVLTNDVALWYVVGANRVYYPRDVDESLDLSNLNIRGYLSRFAAVAEESYDTWATQNAQGIDISTLFARGELRVTGFYFGAGWDRYQPTLVRYFLLSTHRVRAQGYAWDGKDVWHFEESPTGRYSLVAARCPAGGAQAYVATKWQTAIFLPGAAMNQLTTQQTMRVALVAPADRVAAWRALTQSGCQRLFERRFARVGGEPVGRFLSSWKDTARAHTSIQVPQADPQATSVLYGPTGAVHVVSTLDLTQASGWGDTPTQHVGRAVIFTAPPARFQSIFRAELPNPRTTASWIRARVHVIEGLVALCVEDTTRSGCQERLNVAAGAPQTVYLHAGAAAPHLALYLDNRDNTPAVVELSSVQVVAR
jgi:hypothetical protein